MKSKLFNDFCSTSAFILFFIGVVIMAFLIGMVLADLIHWVVFIISMAVTGVIMYLDALWIDRHFVDGEWV